MSLLALAIGLIFVAPTVAAGLVQAELRRVDSGEISKARVAGQCARFLCVLFRARRLLAMADLGLARVHLVEGDCFQAVQIFRRLLDEHPSLPIREHFYLVNCAIEAHITAGRYREAIEVLDHVDNRRWEDARFLQTPCWEVLKINGAEALFEMGRTEDAYALLDEIDLEHASHPIVSAGVRTHRAWMDARPETAAAALSSVEGVDPSPLGRLYQAEWHFTRAKVLLELGRLTEALAAVQTGRDKAIRASSRRNALYLEARIRFAQGDAATAERLAATAAQHPYRGQGGHGLLLWGDALVALGKPDEAAQAWRLVLERDPQSVAARIARDRLRGQ